MKEADPTSAFRIQEAVIARRWRRGNLDAAAIPVPQQQCLPQRTPLRQRDCRAALAMTRVGRSQ